ncbi:MAG: hypothetical protein KJO01_07020 [Gammaproteobacteria bacterium]|nr:hypothetical protein [Gammaproteobacteria bacterium]
MNSALTIVGLHPSALVCPLFLEISRIFRKMTRKVTKSSDFLIFIRNAQPDGHASRPCKIFEISSFSEILLVFAVLLGDFHDFYGSGLAGFRLETVFSQLP